MKPELAKAWTENQAAVLKSAEEGNNVLLGGRAGTGKTALSVAVLEAREESGTFSRVRVFVPTWVAGRSFPERFVVTVWSFFKVSLKQAELGAEAVFKADFFATRKAELTGTTIYALFEESGMHTGWPLTLPLNCLDFSRCASKPWLLPTRDNFLLL